MNDHQGNFFRGIWIPKYSIDLRYIAVLFIFKDFFVYIVTYFEIIDINVNLKIF